MTSRVAPRRRTIPAVLTAAVLAAVALLVPALPAAAHDELISTDPSADSVLDALPDTITFTYSADVLPDQGATVIEVTDSTGASLVSGAPAVDGATVTQALSGSASGAVSVRWRVVSSDGHPIDGSFAFTVPAASPTPTVTPTAEPTPTTSATTAPSATADPVPTPSEAGDTASPLPWILLAVALLAVVGALVSLVAARGRGRGSAGTPGR